MPALNDRLDLLVSTLATMYPCRIVSREAYLVNEPENNDLRSGIYSVISTTGDSYLSTLSDPVDAGNHSLLLIARFRLKDRSKGADVEREELVMVEEIKSFLRRGDLPEQLTGATLTRWQQSAQQEVPSGYVVFELRFLCA